MQKLSEAFGTVSSPHASPTELWSFLKWEGLLGNSWRRPRRFPGGSARYVAIFEGASERAGQDVPRGIKEYGLWGEREKEGEKEREREREREMSVTCLSPWIWFFGEKFFYQTLNKHPNLNTWYGWAYTSLASSSGVRQNYGSRKFWYTALLLPPLSFHLIGLKDGDGKTLELNLQNM